MHRSVKLVSVVLVSLIAACGDSTGPTSLGINRLRWERQNLHDYEYTSRMVCFFCPESGQHVFVTVLSDTIFSVRRVATGVEVPKAGWNTVTQLFELAEGAVRDDYASVTVEFDPERGYPTHIDLTCDDNVLDCGLTIEARNLVPIFFIDN